MRPDAFQKRSARSGDCIRILGREYKCCAFGVKPGIESIRWCELAARIALDSRWQIVLCFHRRTQFEYYSMEARSRPKIVCLGNIYDQHYHELRGEKVDRHLTTPFRRDMYRCLEMASGRELILLSSPPKATERRKGRWLPPLETKFYTHRQFFCANWDVPKLRIPFTWFFYARHVLRHTRSGDLVVMDNYEFIYVFAARLVQMFRPGSGL
jgi:hypothetical protein